MGRRFNTQDLVVEENQIAEEESGKIIVERNGPYIVRGHLPLVEKSEDMSEFGEPLDWVRGKELRQIGNYALCRCGKSNNKPFCDDTHEEIGFTGTEAADSGSISERWTTFSGNKMTIPSVCTLDSVAIELRISGRCRPKAMPPTCWLKLLP